jgi:hypothetical protein
MLVSHQMSWVPTQPPWHVTQKYENGHVPKLLVHLWVNPLFMDQLKMGYEKPQQSEESMRSK